MAPFACDIAHCRGLQIDLEATTAFPTFGIPCNRNVSIVCLQWFTCNANFYPIEHATLLMKAYGILSTMVKIARKLIENWPRYLRIASKIFSMLKLLFQAIASNSNVQSQVK